VELIDSGIKVYLHFNAMVVDRSTAGGSMALATREGKGDERSRNESRCNGGHRHRHRTKNERLSERTRGRECGREKNGKQAGQAIAQKLCFFNLSVWEEKGREEAVHL